MPLVRVEDLHKAFPSKGGGSIHAVNGVSFAIDEGETLGLIGESGSGKSTVGRLVLRLIEADRGVIEVDGRDVRGLGREELRQLRAQMAIVFQEPYESLNPRMRVGDIVEEPLLIHERRLGREDRRERVADALGNVGLDRGFAERYPRALSGGQQQRVGIARAIVTRPRFVVLDEPTSSLDLSVRAQILELLADLQRRLGLAYLFISHDLATVSYVSRRVAVMYLGQIRESGPVDAVVDTPLDPYTRSLLSASLSVDPSEQQVVTTLTGEIPSPAQLPTGCYLYGRCPIRVDECTRGPIELRPVSGDHHVRCIRAPLLQIGDPVHGVTTVP